MHISLIDIIEYLNKINYFIFETRQYLGLEICQKIQVFWLYTLTILSYAALIKECLTFLNKSSKKIYFSILCISGFLIFIQGILIFFSQGTAFYETISFLMFVYGTAILVLFLIFLTLTTMEDYHNRKIITDNIHVIEFSSLTAWLNLIFWGGFIYYETLIIIDTYKYIESKYHLMDWLLGFDNKNPLKENPDNKYKVWFEKHPMYDEEYKYDEETGIATYQSKWIYSEKDGYLIYEYELRRQENKWSDTSMWYNTAINSFCILRAEVLDEFLGYFLSALLQAATLIIVIICLL